MLRVGSSKEGHTRTTSALISGPPVALRAFVVSTGALSRLTAVERASMGLPASVQSPSRADLSARDGETPRQWHGLSGTNRGVKRVLVQVKVSTGTGKVNGGAPDHPGGNDEVTRIIMITWPIPPTVTCLRCAATWVPRLETLPRQCVVCKSPQWNQARKRKIRSDRKRVDCETTASLTTLRASLAGRKSG